MLKSAAKKRLVKAKDFSVSCDYSDKWSVWFSETVLKAVAKKRVVKKKDVHVSCDYSENFSVWFSGTVIVGCDGDP
jgi:phage anti-repressor protein